MTVAHEVTARTASPTATIRSAELFEAANRVIPGGVNSPVRAFRSVGGTPRFIVRGSGARVTDADVNRYIDYVLSWGAQALYGVVPDLTCLGKVIGGGLPAAAYGGRAELMRLLAPMGNVYQAGTLSGNPLAMAAGIASLRALATPGTYEQLSVASNALARAVDASAAAVGVPVQVGAVGGMWGFFLTPTPVVDYATAKTADTRRFARLFHALLGEGVYIAPSQFEACFTSTAHDAATLDATRAALRRAFEIAVHSGDDA
jgi:glutamate-1-semialdehyde aminotransferase